MPQEEGGPDSHGGGGGSDRVRHRLPAFLPSLTIVSFVFILVISPRLACANLLVDRYIEVIFIIQALVAMAFIVFYRQTQYIMPASNPAPTIPGLDRQLGLDFYLSSYAHKLAIYIFGAVSVGSSLVYFINDVYCLISVNKHGPTITNATSLAAPCDINVTTDVIDYWLKDQKSRVTLEFAEVVYFVLSIPFLCLMLKVRKRKASHWSHWLLLVVLMSLIGVWLFTYIRETGLFNTPVQYPEDITVISDFPMACLLHQTAVDDFIATLNPIAYLFCMEFAVVALQILLHVWILPSPQDRKLENPPRQQSTPSGHIRSPSRHQAGGQSGEQLGVSTEQDPLLPGAVPRPVKWWGWIINMNTMYTALVVGIIEATAIKFFTINIEFAQQNPDYIPGDQLEKCMQIPATVFRIVFNLVPSLIVTGHCYRIACSFKERRSNAQGLNETYVILTLGVASIVVLQVFDIIRSFRRFNNIGQQPEVNPAGDAISIIESLLLIFQFIVQTLLIYRAQTYVANREHPLHKGLVGLFSYLAMYNFIRWAINSFLEAEFQANRGDQSNDRFKESWEILIHLCLPLVMYFRYISTFLFLEMKYLLKMDRSAADMGDLDPSAADTRATDRVRDDDGRNGTLPASQSPAPGSDSDSDTP